MRGKTLALFTLAAAAVSILFSGCGGGGVFSTGDDVSFPDVPVVTVSGSVAADGAPAPSLSTAVSWASSSATDSVAVIDADGVLVPKSVVTIQGTGFTAKIPAASTNNKFAVIVFRKNGKDLYQKFIGRIPTAAEVPSGVTISGVTVDDATTVRSLIMRANKLKAPTVPISLRNVTNGDTQYDRDLNDTIASMTQAASRENELRKEFQAVVAAIKVSSDVAGRVQTRFSTLDDLVASFSVVMSERETNVAVRNAVPSNVLTATDFSNLVSTVKADFDSMQKTSSPAFSPLPSSGLTQAQSVSISAATGAIIRYTTDGTKPDKSVNGLTYSGPLQISATTKFIARAFREGSLPSDATSANYVYGASSGGDPGTGTQTYQVAAADYANAAVGREWRYRFTNKSGNSMNWSMRITGVAVKNNVECFILKEYDNNSNPDQTHYIATDLSAGIFKTGGIQPATTDSLEKEWQWSPKLPYLDSSLIGKSASSFKFTDTLSSATYDAIVSCDKTTVYLASQFKTYSDCVHTKVTLNGQGDYLEYWFARGVGMVKSVESLDGSPETMELIEVLY